MHPAHVLRRHFVSVAGGLSGRLVADPAPSAAGATTGASAEEPRPDAGGARETTSSSSALQKLTTAPGVAPFVAARVGFGGGNEGGLAYTGRSLRLDGRHAFSLGGPALSVGVGASALVADRPGGDGAGVYGGGFDVPVLLGVASRGDVYAVWVGPRSGLEWIAGDLALDPAGGATVAPPLHVDARHVWVGGVVGMRAGFRHVHAALEVEVGYHRADGTLGGAPVLLEQVAVTPAGALVFSF